MPNDAPRDYGSEWLEELLQTGKDPKAILDELDRRYRTSGVPEDEIPLAILWPIQRQVMVYANIVEQLKEGREPPDIRRRFEDLGLVPCDTLPNPHGLMDFALGRLKDLRGLLFGFARDRARDWVNTLSGQMGMTVGFNLQTGIPPTLSIYAENNAAVEAGSGRTSRRP